MSPQLFIRRPRFALVISILITLLGVLAAIVMPVDQYPDIAAPKIVVRANYPGASAETVKEAVSSPIEDEVNGAEGMVYMSSKSASDGSYTLTVTFEIDVDPSLAQVDVQNRVALAEPRLPPEVRQRGVSVKKRSPDMLMVVNLLSPDDRFDGVFLSNYASLNVTGELARIPGVGEASIIGALDYGMRVWLDPLKLNANQISVNQVLAAIREQNVQAAVGQLGGPPNPDTTQFQYVLKTQGRLSSPEEFGSIILRSDERGSVLRLADVARIELGAPACKGFGEFNNRPGVLLAVYKLSDASALETAGQVRARMEELKQYFPEGVDYVVGHDTTLFIQASLEETFLTLVFTIVLVILVTYLFLGNLRATLVPTIAVPVAVIGTLAVLYAFGMTINTVTLFAMILSIGVVVDDATLVVSVLISSVNALSLSPALCVLLLREGEHRPNLVIRAFNSGFAEVTRGYVALVGFLAARLVVSSVVIALLFVALWGLYRVVPSSFIPEEDKGFFIVDVQLPAAASLNRTAQTMDRIHDMIATDPAVENVLSVNGYSLLNTALQSNAGMIIVKLKPWGDRTTPETHQFTLQRKYQMQLSGVDGASVLAFGAPAIPGLGAVAGFSYALEDTQARGAQEMAAMVDSLLQQANARPEITRAFSTFRADYPQI